MTATPLAVSVHSEIGALRRVLVHRPGPEIVRMTQHDLERMLFDDILAPDECGAEHDVMTGILRDSGAEIVEIETLLARAMAEAPADARRQLVEDVCEVAGVADVADELLDWAPGRLAQGLVAGVPWSAITTSRPSLARLRAGPTDEPGGRWALLPVPNLMFMRDPCISVFDRVVVGRMATQARAREPLLVAFALQAAGVRLAFDGPDARRSERARGLEGGDLLVLSRRALMIGCSIRTKAQTLERLAADSLFPGAPQLERIFVVLMPEARSVMHLDTILTQIDEHLFLGHRRMITGRDALPVAELRRDTPPRLLEGANALDALRDELGPDVQLVPCGGDDPLHAEREQWTDGANAIAVAPGHIVLYARNAHTLRALAEHGFRSARLSVVQPPDERTAIVREGNAAPRTVYSFSGSELSRARGGGRCLTMPLMRD